MTYPCLVLDHDDTVVNSTATVHYPCFAEYTAKFFPKAKRYTLEEYVLKNFDPGVYDFFHGEVGMTEEDMKHEQAYWHEYVQHHVPQVYDGMRDILWDYVHAGGTICVVSHSLSPNILRDYRENKLPEPKLVYGWEVPKDRRKPQPHALYDIMEKLGFTAEQMLVLDDLKPGYDMAKAANVRFAAAGWSNDIPEIAVVDPDMMSSMPKGLTAATGMDALTHAIEGYITKGHCTISDMFHLEAIKLISENLRGAVQNTPEGREGMALGQYIAGMGFSNVGLGIVHSMAHGLSALYDTPHGVACAIILPTGLEYNKTVAGERYRAVGKAMGVTGIDEMNDVEAADATIAAVKKLSADVGIPADLKGILKEEDVQFLAESAFADACCPGNPRDTSVEEIKELYRSLM